MPDPTCSSISRDSAEPLAATASIVRHWVLVEQPGAWGPDALQQSAVPADQARALAALGRRHGFRVLLLRAPDRPRTDGHHCFVAHAGRHTRWIEERVVDDLDELLAVDFSPLGDGRRVGFGELRRLPLYLVCTNGRHDPCCANLGRPVARALRRDHDNAVWECSHFGGDRFAGNLVCLPHGLYFGRLSPEDAQAVVAGYEAGRIDLSHYRGRAGESFAAQAAEFFVRRDHGLSGVDDLVVTGQSPRPDGAVAVCLAGPDRRQFEVTVGIRPAGEGRPLSCGASGPSHPPTYELIGLRTD